MTVSFPIRLDSEVLVQRDGAWVRTKFLRQEDMGHDGLLLDPLTGRPVVVSGYTLPLRGAGRHGRTRVTNLCRIRAGRLEKKCPRCGAIHPADDFGPLGRTCDGRHRDQADCPTCRSARRSSRRMS